MNRPKTIILVCVFSLLLLGALLPPETEIPEYPGPVRVCAKPEPSLLNLFCQRDPEIDRSASLASCSADRVTEIKPLYEPATLVDRFINANNPTAGAGAGAQQLTTTQKNGLAQWQSCAKDVNSTEYDLQCSFDAFNQLFFGGHLAPVKVGWEQLEGGTMSKVLGGAVFGVMRYSNFLDTRRRPTISILSRESPSWRLGFAPTVHGALLHEMVHAYFALYACEDALHFIDPDGHPLSTYSARFLRNVGITGHGPEWLRMVLALEKLATQHLGLGVVNLPWKSSIEQEWFWAWVVSGFVFSFG